MLLHEVDQCAVIVVVGEVTIMCSLRSVSAGAAVFTECSSACHQVSIVGYSRQHMSDNNYVNVLWY